jgi:hypothetical protein
MATDTAGDVGQVYHTNQVHYLAKTITYADAGKTVTIGVLPSGAVVIPGISGVAVNVVFNGDTTNTVTWAFPAPRPSTAPRSRSGHLAGSSRTR